MRQQELNAPEGGHGVTDSIMCSRVGGKRDGEMQGGWSHSLHGDDHLFIEFTPRGRSH